jgi:hypothetical protein
MLAVMTGLIVTMTLWPPSSGAIESADERKEHDVAPAAA